jgi:ABC-2 type transport system permease protein
MRDVFRIASRILAQLVKDPRFLALAAAAPVLLVLLLKYVFGRFPQLSMLVRIDVYALPAGGFFIFFFTYILCTIVLIRERRDGTLARMFSCGYRRHHVILGYVAGYSLTAAIQTGLVVTATILLFDVTLGASAVGVVATTMSLSVVSLAFGVFVSTLLRTEGQIFPTIPLVIVPSLLLSGLVLPHESLAPWMRAVSYAIPLTYAEKVLLGLLRDGKPFGRLLPEFLLLVGYGAALLAAASLTLREEE